MGEKETSSVIAATVLRLLLSWESRVLGCCLSVCPRNHPRSDGISSAILDVQAAVWVS